MNKFYNKMVHRAITIMEIEKPIEVEHAGMMNRGKDYVSEDFKREKKCIFKTK